MNMKKLFSTRVLALALAAGVLLTSTACGGRGGESSSSDSSSASSTSSSSKPSSSVAPPQDAKSEPVKPAKDKADKLAEKVAANKDVVGWVTIPGTDIDDPLLRGENDLAKKEHFYERRDFSGQYSFSGSYFPDYDVVIGDRDKMSNITILYGHSMDDDPNGEDFSQLKRYLDPAFAQKNMYLNYVTEDDDMYFKVFATPYTDINLPYFYPDKSGDELEDLISQLKKKSTLNFDVDVNKDDKLLIMSTCTYTIGNTLEENRMYRFLVCARLLRPGETIEDAAPAVEKNPNPEQPVYPFKWASQS